MDGSENVKSAVLLRIWEKFHEHGIEIPYPQRDLHLRSVDAELLKTLSIGAYSPVKEGSLPKT